MPTATDHRSSRPDPHLSDADAFTLHCESDPLLRSTIVAVALLDRPPRWDRLVETVERATRLEPNFRRRLVPGVGPLVPARWTDDPDFDLTWHLRRIGAPEPRTIDAVLEFARIAGMTAFDPARPRWEFTVVEGLADGSAAFVMKVHHALTDGIGGIQLAQHVVDLDRRGTRRPRIEEPPPGHPERLTERITDAVTHDVERAGTVVRDAVLNLPRALVEVVRRPLSVWSDVAQVAMSVARLVRPITTTLSPVMTDRRLGWRYHCFEVPLAVLKRSAAMADGTVNDGFLAGVAAGLAGYHERHGSVVEELRVTMPISTRTEADGPGGNHVSLVRFTVPVGDHDPISRLLAIDHRANVVRHEPAIGLSASIAGALNLLPTGVVAGMLRHVDVLASNVPGFDAPVFVAGARLERFFAFGPTMGAAANVTLMSYRGRCCIGVTTDTGAVPDPEAFVACLEAGFAELAELVDRAPPGTPGAASAARRTPARRRS